MKLIIAGAVASLALTLAGCGSAAPRPAGPPSAASLAAKPHCTGIKPAAPVDSPYFREQILCLEPTAGGDYANATEIFTFGSVADEKTWTVGPDNGGTYLEGHLWAVQAPANEGGSGPSHGWVNHAEAALGGRESTLGHETA